MYMFESLLNSIPKNRSEFVNELEIPEITVEPYIWTDLESISTRSESPPTTVTQEEEDTRSVNTASSVPLSRAMTDSDIDYNRADGSDQTDSDKFKHRRYSDPWDYLKAAEDAFPSTYLESLRRHGLYPKYRYDGSLSRYYNDSSYYYRYGTLPYYKYDVPLPKSYYDSKYYYGSYKYPLSTYQYDYGYEVPLRSYRYGDTYYSYYKPWLYSYYRPWRYSYHRPWGYSFQTSSEYVDDVLRESRLKRYEYNEKLLRKLQKDFDDCRAYLEGDPGLTRLEEALLDIDWKNFVYDDYYPATVA